MTVKLTAAMYAKIGMLIYKNNKIVIRIYKEQINKNVIGNKQFVQTVLKSSL